jgi:hypothetical protein
VQALNGLSRQAAGRAVVAMLGSVVLIVLSALQPAGADTLPDRISDRDFWSMVEESSEPEGAFQSESLVSTEAAYQRVIPDLLQRVEGGGVYVGVGPEQNFTYISALKPKLAFIVDLRRQNLLEHLLYKAIFELSEDRSAFLARLFGRAQVASAGPDAGITSLISAYTEAVPNRTAFRKATEEVRNQLIRRHGFGLSESDLATIERLHVAFFEGGTSLRFSFGGRPSPRLAAWFPTFAALMTETDGNFTNRSFLASEAGYAAVKEMQERNLIVPLVGDVAGGQALRAVGEYLREHGAAVSAIYVSNNEQFLFRDGDGWRQFYENLDALPTTSKSVLIRSVASYTHPNRLGPRPRPRFGPIAELVAAYRAGRITTYTNITDMWR